ncbi:muts protein 4 [Tribonema minus]|uniref:Muts protein 4 n=1 Tax=Tribonema minus TaxID=303371 RepID=A0A836CNW6_9STRA|nr:muts protein 4 [Tribonema minus]
MTPAPRSARRGGRNGGRASGGRGTGGSRRTGGTAAADVQTADGSSAGGNSSNSGLVVCAVVENRSRETCVAVTNTSHASLLEITTLSDTQSYAQTMAHLESLQPQEILLHDGARSRVLSLKIVEAFHKDDESRVLFVSRQYFDQDKGAELLRRISTKNLGADVFATYIVLAATNCLLRYVENITGHGHAPNSLRVSLCSGNQGRMVIDRSTALELELIVNARAFDQRRSLFGVINRTKTSVGARLLRSNILSPSTDLPTLEARLDLVAFFLSSERVFAGTLEHLSRFADLDRMLSGLVTVPKAVTPQTAAKGIETVICLRHTVQLLAPIVETLEEGMEEMRGLGGGAGESTWCHAHMIGATGHFPADTWPMTSPLAAGDDDTGSELLKAIVDNLKDPSLAWIEGQISGILTEASITFKSALQMRHQECFAVQPDINGMLDVARKTFLQSVEDIYALADAYTQEYREAPCSVRATAARGYHLQVPGDVPELPEMYIQAVKSSKFISCTTEQVASLSDRANEALGEALLLTNQVIQDLMETVRRHMESLFAVVESVALLDMLFGFADLVATSRLQYTRPTLVQDGELVIERGVHPIVGALLDGSKRFVPNGISMGPLSNFCVVTGANGSGKSTLLRQTACIAVLAQIGCFVPAAAARIPLRDRLLTRLATSDDMENNLSSFLVEMREAAHVLGAATPRALVLVDELGRGTSTEEGRAIAWAVCEALLSRPALTLFATHYTELCGLADTWPNGRNLSLRAADDAGAPVRVRARRWGVCRGLFGVRFERSHAGPSADLATDYGIQMAEQCGFLPELIAEARAVRRLLLDTAPARGATSAAPGRGGGSSGGGGGGAEEPQQQATADALRLLSLLAAAPEMEAGALREAVVGVCARVDMGAVAAAAAELRPGSGGGGGAGEGPEGGAAPAAATKGRADEELGGIEPFTEDMHGVAPAQ